MNIDELQTSPLYEFLLAQPQWVGMMIMAIAFAESFALIGVAVPGVVLLSVAAFVAGSGVLSVQATLAAAFAGAVLGDGSSYWIGRLYSQQLLGLRRFRQQSEWIKRSQTFFHHHGVVSIVVGRFIGPIRPIMPLVAGTLGMRAKQFFLVNILSGLLWAPLYMLPGFMLGASIETALEPRTIVLIAAATIGLLAAFFYTLRRYFRAG